jgi:hypothetical protein
MTSLFVFFHICVFHFFASRSSNFYVCKTSIKELMLSTRSAYCGGTTTLIKELSLLVVLAIIYLRTSVLFKFYCTILPVCQSFNSFLAAASKLTFPPLLKWLNFTAIASKTSSLSFPEIE